MDYITKQSKSLTNLYLLGFSIFLKEQKNLFILQYFF